MPSTTVSTIGSGRDYSTIQAWEDASPANLVSNDEIWEGRLYAEGGGTDGEWTGNAITFSGSTTDATRYKRLLPAAGAGFADAASPALRYDPAKGVAFRSTGGYANAYGCVLGDDYGRIEGLQVKSNSSIVVSASATGVRALGCILERPSGGGYAIAASAAATFENCVVIGGIYQVGSPPSYNACTFLTATGSITFAVSGYGSVATLKNCALFGFSAYGAGFGSGSSYNGSDLSSLPGSNNVTSLTASDQFEDATYGSSLDLRLKAGADLIDAGDSSGSPAADIVGTARSGGYDIGAFEYASAMPTVPNITFVGAENILATSADYRVTLDYA